MQNRLRHDHSDRWRLRTGENLLPSHPARQARLRRLVFLRLRRQDLACVRFDLEDAGYQGGSPVEKRGRVSLGFDPVDEELGKRSPVLPDVLGPFFDQASFN